MTRLEALQSLLAKVEAGGVYDSLSMRRALPGYDIGRRDDADCAFGAYRGSRDAAASLVKAVLPGWGYRICECHLSDDAAVFPDFNCPEHGPRLKASLDESVDWFGLTDVDQRPAGNPARALLRAILKALIAQEQAA